MLDSLRVLRSVLVRVLLGLVLAIGPLTLTGEICPTSVQFEDDGGRPDDSPAILKPRVPLPTRKRNPLAPALANRTAFTSLPRSVSIFRAPNPDPFLNGLGCPPRC